MMSPAARLHRYQATRLTTKLAFSRKEVCQTLSIGTTKLHELINDGKLETFKIGRKTLVKAESVRRLVDEAA